MKTPTISFILPSIGHQKSCVKLIIEGMKKHGIENFDIVDNITHFKGSDLAVLWGWRPYLKGAKWDTTLRKQAGRPVMVMERAYIANREEWFSFGFNGLNGRADFCNQRIVDISRWNQHFKNELKPWRQPQGKRVLVCGQSYGDASIHHINIDNWYINTCYELRKNGYDVIFREHPLNKQPWDSAHHHIPKDINPTLEKTLLQVDYVVTYNSNSGVISVLNGLPTVSCDIGSMAYSVTSHSLNDLSALEPNRLQWCAKMAYTQWLPKEIENGESWEHLKQIFN